MKYIGITGITKKVEIDILSSFLSENYKLEPNHNYQIMLGILVSYKILDGENNNKERYVKKSELHELCKYAKEKGFFTIIHYNSHNNFCYGEINQIIKEHSLKDQIHGLQLNVSQPHPHLYLMLKTEYPQYKLIYSLNKNFFTKNNQLLDEETIQDRIMKQFSSLMSSYIDYVLIDLSMGTGIPLNIEFSSNIFKWIREENKNIEIGFAGGFSDENIGTILKSLSNDCGSKEFSIDAESKLRSKHDYLIFDKVFVYLNEAKAFFNE